MKRRFETVDVFTDRRFGGNPLAVVLDSEGLDAAQMQAIAREFNYAETTFVLPPADASHTAHVRIFTPGQEVPFAGHPNVGTASVLARDEATLLFEEAGGLVPVAILRDGGLVVGAELTAPQALVQGAEVTPETVAACLSLSPAALVGTPRVLSVGLPFVVAELGDRETLRHAMPDAAAFRAAMPLGADAIYVYVRDGSEVHARMFAPLDGIPEDPATGSATAALAAHLAATQGVVAFTAYQGFDMGRPSVIAARAVIEAGAVRSVHVGGRCVRMFQGLFEL